MTYACVSASLAVLKKMLRKVLLMAARFRNVIFTMKKEWTEMALPSFALTATKASFLFHKVADVDECIAD